MRVYKNLSIITVILYLIGVMITAMYLINIPDQLNTALPTLYTKMDKISHIFYNMYLIVGIELILGVSAIIFLYMGNQKKAKENIIYVDKYSGSKSDEEVEAGKVADTKEFKEDIKSKLSSIHSILSGREDLKKEMEKALSFICNEVEACQGAIFLKVEKEGKRFVKLHSSYAYSLAESAELEYEFGEGLTGQAAKAGKVVKVDSVPDGYIKIFSGLGKSSPSHLMFIPLKTDDETLGVIEIASFKQFLSWEEEFLKELSTPFSDYINSKQVVEASN